MTVLATLIAAVPAAVLAAAPAYLLGRTHTTTPAYLLGRTHTPTPATTTTIPDPSVDVPRVSVRVVSEKGRHGAEADAEISDGHLTAESTAWCQWQSTRPGDWPSSPPRPWDRAGYVEAASRATQEAIQQARWALSGAQAGYAAWAEQDTQAEPTTTKADA